MTEQAIPQNDSTSPSSNRSGVKRSVIRFILPALVVGLALASVYFYLVSPRHDQNAESDSFAPREVTDPSTIDSFAPAAGGVEDIPPTAVTAKINQELVELAEHPLDPLLVLARAGADYLQENVQDYTATIVKRVRWRGRLQDEQHVACKIRHAVCTPDPETSIPFSVYTRFLKPKAGQEAIWVQGCHDDKIVAHGPPGLLNVMTIRLDPEGSLAMSGNRYPIQSIGMLNLILQMIEKGEHDRKLGDCEVKITRNVMIGDARCTRLEIIHHEADDRFDFHQAEIYIDDDRNLPIAYRGFTWPDEPGGQPKLLERYLYKDIEINVGLTDRDFDPRNPDYNFPGN